MEKVFDRSVHPLYAIMAFASAILVLMLLTRTLRERKTKSREAFFPLFCWMLAFCVQDGIWGLFAAHIVTNDTMLFITSTVFHLSSALTTFIWVRYHIRSLGDCIRHPVTLEIISLTFVAVQVVMLIVNAFTRFMFFVDEDGYYVSTEYRRILFYLQFAIYIAIAVITLIKLFNQHEVDDKHNLFAVLSINAMPVFAGVFQMIYPDAPANSLGFSLGCVMIFTFVAAEYERQVVIYREKASLQSIIEKQNEELKHQGESLRDALDMARSASNAKTSFLFNMSHDIRTPMNAIIGYTDMALRHTDDQRMTVTALRKVKKAGEFLLSIINDVLEMARIESGKTEIVEGVENICELTETVVQMIAMTAEDRGISVHLQNENITSPNVWADKNRLDQILSNLLSNAVKYTKKGGSIWLKTAQIPSVHKDHAVYRIVVKDTGIGMSKEFQEKIFDEFEREKNSTVSGIQGTGLGMSIVKKLVDLLGGTIAVESELGVGTTITLVLELRIATEEDMLLEQKRKNEREIQIRDISGLKVLLVEDNEMNREIAQEILESHGVVVDTAEDGDIAVEKIVNADPGRYDVILMDVQMPRMNGYEATKMIRRMTESTYANIPIIAMTANAFDEDKQDAMLAGMNGHVAKPFEINELISALSSV